MVEYAREMNVKKSCTANMDHLSICCSGYYVVVVVVIVVVVAFWDVVIPFIVSEFSMEKW